MTNEMITYLWLVLGVLLVLAELVVPGLVVVFLGIAALMVAAAIGAGWLEGWLEILTAWFISSLVLIFSLRNVLARFLPGDTEVGNMDEDVDAQGLIVVVDREVHPYDETGRIVFRGTTWAARCPDMTLPKGALARLRHRKINTWIIAPVLTDKGETQRKD